MQIVTVDDETRRVLTSEARAIVTSVERQTGLRSRWTGEIRIVRTDDFEGMKAFSCSICLTSALLSKIIRESGVGRVF